MTSNARGVPEHASASSGASCAAHDGEKCCIVIHRGQVDPHAQRDGRGDAFAWPARVGALRALVGQNGGSPTQRLARTSSALRVTPITVRRWLSGTPESPSSAPFAPYALLALAHGELTLERLEWADRPATRRERMSADAEARLREAASAIAAQAPWRPSATLIEALVAPAAGARHGGGVRLAAEALRVERSTVQRWIDRRRERPTISYAAWALLLVRDGFLGSDALALPAVRGADGRDSEDVRAAAATSGSGT